MSGSSNNPNFHQIVVSQRQNQQGQATTFNRIMLVGFLNEEHLKKNNQQQFDVEAFVKKSVLQFVQHKLHGYLYVKGCFYIHFIECGSMEVINEYMQALDAISEETPELFKQLRVVYQSYESNERLFRQPWQCDYTQQAGPILMESDKLEEQILQRAAQIYDLFEDGAKKKSVNHSHKIGNMILLSNDDMSILVSDQFMSGKEYLRIYCGEMKVIRQADLNYPLPPNMFDMIEFIEQGGSSEMSIPVQ